MASKLYLPFRLSQVAPSICPKCDRYTARYSPNTWVVNLQYHYKVCHLPLYSIWIIRSFVINSWISAFMQSLGMGSNMSEMKKPNVAWQVLHDHLSTTKTDMIFSQPSLVLRVLPIVHLLLQESFQNLFSVDYTIVGGDFQQEGESPTSALSIIFLFWDASFFHIFLVFGNLVKEIKHLQKN